jgi:nicotinate phosphoribosyltransferase
VLELTASLLEAQLVESLVVNKVHFQSLIASKGARCVDVAGGRRLVEFGLRRAHGGEAGLKAARASYLAGFDATSNVLAGRRFGIPIAGTMAHSYVECFKDETAAFEAYTRSYPDGATLLIDTYDTVEGARRAIAVAHDLAGRGRRLGGVRLDSGDLLALSLRVRDLLDQAGLTEVTIFASGNLDEHEIGHLLRAGAPIDGFGVGSRLVVAADAPYVDLVYKLVAFDGRPVLKLSAEKTTLPGLKQVWRRIEDGSFGGDHVALRDEGEREGAVPLLESMMRDGICISHASLEEARERAASQRAALAGSVRGADAGVYGVEISTGLDALRQPITEAVLRGGALKGRLGSV